MHHLGRARIAAVLACLLLLGGAPDPSRAQPAGNAPSAAGALPTIPTTVPPPAIAAASGILVTEGGSILWSKNARSRRAVASTTKILTALVAIEENEPGEVVTASPRAEAVGANDALVTELELTAGEQLTVEQLLYGLLLPSGSDAAVALAEHTAGSIPRFAQMMNERARELGATDSNFTNADGLDDPAAYSTAYDLALVTRAALRNEMFRRIVATPAYEIPWRGRPEPRRVVNRNLLLGRFPGITGVKTGNTRQAGPSLVASARRADEERVSVILGSPDPFAESERILEYGFSAFRRVRIVGAQQPWGQLTYGDGTTHTLVSPTDVDVLLGVSSPAPATRYRPQGNELVIDVPGGLTVPLETSCGEPPCRPPRSKRSVLAAFISLFGPALSILK